MVRVCLEERRRQAQKNVELGRQYVQQHTEVASVLEREGRSARLVRERLQVLRDLLEMHECDLDRVEVALLELDHASVR